MWYQVIRDLGSETYSSQKYVELLQRNNAKNEYGNRMGLNNYLKCVP